MTMMRFKYLLKIMAMSCMMFLAVTNSAYANALQEIEGINFWHGDMSYPVFDTGNAFCMALDMDSSYVISDDEEELVIAVSTISINYGEDAIVDESEETFHEQKNSGKAWLRFSKSGNCMEVGRTKMLNDVYYYLKTCMGKN